MNTSDSASTKLRAIIVEDHPVFRDGLIAALKLDPKIELIAQFDDGIKAIEGARQLQPDLMLLDVNLPNNMNGLEVLHAIRGDNLPTRVIVLTAHHDIEQTLHVINSGAHAYANKDISSDDLLKTLHLIAKGYYVIDGKKMTPQQLQAWKHQKMADLSGPYNFDDQAHYIPLSPREMEILRFVTQGMSNKAIAYELKISQQTVKNHMTSILRKLNVEDRTQAAIAAIRRGWVRIQDSG